MNKGKNIVNMMSQFGSSHFSSHSSGASITPWLAFSQIPSFNPLTQDIRTDVGIVGGGIAGLSVAYNLIKQGKEVTLLEDGELLSGETGRTTAHLMSAIDDKYYEIERSFGVEYSQLAYQSHSGAIDHIERICKEESIDCHFTRLNGYLFAGSDGDDSLLDKEFEAAKRAGFYDVEMVSSVPGRENMGRALKFPRQGQFDAVKYCKGLMSVIVGSGKAQIYTNTHAQEFKGGDKAHITSKDGHKVFCNDIVVATCSPVNDHLVLVAKMEPYRTYAISARVKKGSVPQALYWDTADPYHYVRLTPDDRDPENYDLLITGGEDHVVARQHDYEERFEKLEKWTRQYFPEMGAMEHKWSGEVYEPVDMLAYIGRNPMDDRNVYVVTGDSGTGMTHATIAGTLVPDLIFGRENPFEHIYNPSRKPTEGKLALIKNLTTANLQYVDWIESGDIKDIEDLAVGCGAVMRDGLSKVTVFKDEKGNVHRCSAVCPHMKAIVRWNSLEKSFDCPAHGSRFDPYGKVVNGPSNGDLEPLEGTKASAV